jgi:hypothetical protein
MSRQRLLCITPCNLVLVSQPRRAEFFRPLPMPQSNFDQHSDTLWQKTSKHHEIPCFSVDDFSETGPKQPFQSGETQDVYGANHKTWARRHLRHSCVLLESWSSPVAVAQRTIHGNEARCMTVSRTDQMPQTAWLTPTTLGARGHVCILTTRDFIIHTATEDLHRLSKPGDGVQPQKPHRIRLHGVGQQREP